LKKELILLIISALKNPLHARRAYKIREIMIDCVTTASCRLGMPWCFSIFNKYRRWEHWESM